MAQWWDEWQLRILVLASLCAQYLLVLFAGFRKFHIPPWLRSSFRLAQIGSNALALFVLAMLFNRQKGGPRCSYARGSRDLELLWAPIVLMHLGGQVVITSYKIEDNEQWSRHILTSLSKVTIALYVFYKSWSSDDKRLLATTILLFILVIIRCCQKVWNLKSSSFHALLKANPSKVSRIQGTNVSEEEEQLDRFIPKAREIVKKDLGGTSHLVNFLREVFSFAPGDKAPILPEHLFSDLPCSYSDRLKTLRIFWSLEIESAYKAIEAVLSDMTSNLYTKDDATDRKDIGYTIVRVRLMCRTCSNVVSYGNATLIIAICLVHTSTHKQAHRGEDTWVTLVLLYGTLLLELVYVFVQSAFMGRFSGRILQRSLIGLLTHNRRFSRLRRIAGWLRCKDLFDDYFWQMKPSYSCEEITELVRWYVKTWWTSVSNRQDYMRLNDTRGDHTLTKNGLKGMAWSIQRPFDESIILWHLATEFCFHRECKSPDSESSSSFSIRRTGDGPPGDARSQCKVLSNYMMHLLFDNPEMLMPGSRKSLFTMACDELEEILKSDKTPRDEMGFTQELIEKCKDGSIPDDSFVRDAWLLVQSLQGDFNEETKMWEVIQGVWVEMLCFSACRCRGYLHAEALGTGVEYLSYAWVLLAFSGMQTFPEKLQRREVFGMETN